MCMSELTTSCCMWGHDVVMLVHLASTDNKFLKQYRVYSLRNLGPKQDLTLDMGAYRYMPLAQPLITDIIQNLLQLPNRLYQVPPVAYMV